MSGGVAVDFSALSKAGTSLAAGLEESRKSTLLQALGGQVQAGDYAGAAKTAFDAGDLQTGLSLVKLGESKAQAADYSKLMSGGLMSVLGGQSPDTGTVAPVDGVAPVKPVGPSFSATGGGAGGYLATLRGVESGGNANAKNPNSTATGVDQFTASTWAGLMKKYPELGLTANGRTDPAQSTRAMEKFTGDNANALTSAGVPITPGNLYVSHFLGQSGGPRFIRGAMANPDAPAVQFVDPGAAAANRTIFYNRDGSPKTAREVYAERTSRFGGSGATAGAVAAAPAAPSGDGRVQVASADPGFMPQMPSPAAGSGVSPTGPRMTLPDADAAPAGPAMTLPAEADPVPAEQRVQIAQAAPQVMVTAGMKPQVAATFNGMQPGSAARIQFLVRAMSHPGAPEGSKEAMKTLLANELQMDKENRSMTAEQKEYNWDVANGFKGDPMAWRAAKANATRAEKDPAEKVRVARRDWQALGLPNPDDPANAKYWQDFGSKALGGGGPLVTVDNSQKAENEQDKVAQKDLGDFQVKTREGARNAASSLGSIRVMKQLIEDPTFYSGTFGSLATEGKRALASLGLGAADGARANEGFSKLSSQFILDKAGGSLGGGFSNGDRTFIQETGPNIANTPAGNKLILEMAERVALRQQEVHTMMIDYKARNKGRIDDGFLAQIDRLAAEKPVFAGLENMASGAVRGAPQPAPGQRDAGLKPLSPSIIASAKQRVQAGERLEDVAAHLRSKGYNPAGL